MSVRRRFSTSKKAEVIRYDLVIVPWPARKRVGLDDLKRTCTDGANVF